jgi:hypothetical protein
VGEGYSRIIEALETKRFHGLSAQLVEEGLTAVMSRQSACKAARCCRREQQNSRTASLKTN